MTDRKSRPAADDSAAMSGGDQAAVPSTPTRELQAAPTTPPAKERPEPALTQPEASPAIPRDEFHGRGGAYVLVDGKRVPAADQGKPLPAAK